MATMRRYPAEIELADENLIAFLFIFFWNFQYAIKNKTKQKTFEKMIVSRHRTKYNAKLDL